MPGLPELGSDVSAFLLPPECPVSLRRCQVCKPGLIAEGKGLLGVTLVRWQSLGPPNNASQHCRVHQQPRLLIHCLHLRLGILAFLPGHAQHLGESLSAEFCDSEHLQESCAPHSASTLGCCALSFQLPGVSPRTCLLADGAKICTDTGILNPEVWVKMNSWRDSKVPCLVSSELLSSMGFIWKPGYSSIYTEGISPFRSLKMWGGGKFLDVRTERSHCQAWSVDAACWHKVAAQPSLFSGAPLRRNRGPPTTCPWPLDVRCVCPTGCCPHPARGQNYGRDKSCCMGQLSP